MVTSVPTCSVPEVQGEALTLFMTCQGGHISFLPPSEICPDSSEGTYRFHLFIGRVSASQYKAEYVRWEIFLGSSWKKNLTVKFYSVDKEEIRQCKRT